MIQMDLFYIQVREDPKYPISNIVKTLLDLNTNKDQTAMYLRKASTHLIHTWTGSIVILDHVNSTIEQNKQDHIVGYLNSQFRSLSKNV